VAQPIEDPSDSSNRGSVRLAAAVVPETVSGTCSG